MQFLISSCGYTVAVHAPSGNGDAHSHSRLMTRARFFLTALAVLFHVTAAWAAFEPMRFSIKNWLERDGHPLGEVRGIAQDKLGYLWLGTSTGLLRFDGVRFVQWQVQPPLPDAPLKDIRLSPD